MDIIAKFPFQMAVQIVNFIQIAVATETGHLFRLSGTSNVFTNNGCVVSMSRTYTKRISSSRLRSVSSYIDCMLCVLDDIW